MSSKVHADLHESVRRSLTSRDVRYTAGRRKVIETLCGAPGPRSAAELLDETHGVPLSSLYRSLTVLDEAGVLRRQHDADGLARYELAEWLTGHHHHLVCIECGGVEDVALDPEHESEVRRVVTAIGATAEFRAVAHTLEIEGRCARCA